MSEIPAKTDNFKWVITNEEKANELGLILIRVDDYKTILCIELSMIPVNVTIEEYINFIQDTGIVFNCKQ